MMNAWKDDPTVVRAKYPETLCANTITMGAAGDQKQLNVVAFGNAYERFASETKAQLAEEAKAQTAEMISTIQALQTQLGVRDREVSDANRAIQRHLETINRLDRENIVYQLRAGVPTDEIAGVGQATN